MGLSYLLGEGKSVFPNRKTLGLSVIPGQDSCSGAAVSLYFIHGLLVVLLFLFGVVLFVFFIDIVLCCFLDWGFLLRVCLFYEKELKVEWGMRGRRSRRTW